MLWCRKLQKLAKFKEIRRICKGNIIYIIYINSMTHIYDSFQKENATATYPVPDSCCVDKTENCGFEYNDENLIYSEGCIKKIG